MSKRETLVNASEITKGFYTKAGDLRTVEPGETVTVGEEIAARLKADGFKPEEKEKKAKNQKEPTAESDEAAAARLKAEKEGG